MKAWQASKNKAVACLDKARMVNAKMFDIFSAHCSPGAPEGTALHVVLGCGKNFARYPGTQRQNDSASCENHFFGAWTKAGPFFKSNVL